MNTEASNVELVEKQPSSGSIGTSVTSKFSKTELANFAKAFDVFDVNKDGKISTTEIFDVLHAMGNEVSAKRKAKIKEAVAAVDKDSSGDLNQAEFVEFMGIMQQYNIDEKNTTVPEDSQNYAFDAPVSELDATYSEVPYGCCGSVAVSRRAEETASVESVSSKLNRLLVFIVWAFQFLYVVVVLLMVLSYELNSSFNRDDVPMGLFPEVNNKENKMGKFVHILRLLNVLNWLVFFKIMLKVRHVGPDVDNFRLWGFDVTFWNRLRYHSRPLFIWNALTNIFFLGGFSGLDTSNVSSHGRETVENEASDLVLPIIQLITAFWCLSPFWYLSRTGEVLKSRMKTFLSDFSHLNFLRGVLMLVMCVTSFFALPFVLLSVVPIALCGGKTLSTKGSGSYKVFYLLEYLSVENFHTCCQCKWGITSGA